LDEDVGQLTEVDASRIGGVAQVTNINGNHV
jgi:hypothetical protein